MLIVKLPPNKPPFIGMLYSDSWSLNEINQELVIKHKNAGYRIVFEFINGILNIRLISEAALVVKFYNNVSYDKEKLKAWIYLTKDKTSFNFSHIYIKDGKETVVRTKEKGMLFVLPVQSYEVIGNIDSEKQNNYYLKAKKGL